VINDAEAIVSLAIKTFRDTFDEMNTPENMMLYLNSTFTLKRIREEMKEPGAVFFVAEIDDEIVGYARVRESKQAESESLAKPIELERLYVDKNLIGQRVGYMLMKTCLEYATDHHYETVWLGVWEHNLRAIDFYKKWGFSVFGDHIFLLGKDPQTDLLMKKKL
jgi:ribosomal protein S18 acetylase RimI-like enzyme